MNPFRSRGARLLTGVLLIAGVGAVAASAATTGTSPAKQIAALKRQVAALVRENTRLRAQLADVSSEGVSRQLAKTKAALDKYQSVDRAKADGYAAASPCEFFLGGPGNASSDQGGMGVHFVNPAIMQSGKLDPAKPPILVYQPTANGGFQLVAAEYFKPDEDQNTATDGDRPTLFGRAFDGPMLGHAPGMPIHYDLHVWLWKANPSGTFAPWNPTVKCP